MRYPLLQEAALPPRPGQPPRPVPERVGEPSVFKHVVYIIKENRTYDQVLGDMKEGNGDPSLCIFGERDHAQPAQAGPPVRAARQHLLLRHPQRRRPPVGRHRLRHRLHGTLLRRVPAQLPGWHGRRRHRRAGLFARGIHLGQRHRARQDAARLRRIRHHRGALEGLREKGRPRVPRLLPRLHQPNRRNRDPQPARHRVAAAVSGDEHGRLGHEHSGCLPRRAVHRGAEAIRGSGADFPNLSIICLPNDHTSGTKARLPHARRPGGRQRPRPRPDRRGHQPQPVLAGDVHLRHRGRSAERLGPRERLSAPRPTSPAPTRGAA